MAVQVDEKGTPNAGHQDAAIMEQKPGALRRCSSIVDNALGDLYESLGHTAAVHSFKVIALTVALCLGCMAGFGCCWETENRSDKLWVPQETIGQDQAEYMRATYGEAPRREEIVAAATAAGGALSKAMLLEWLRLHEGMEGLTAEGGETSKKKFITGNEEPATAHPPAYWELDTLCIKRGDSCWTSSVLSLWCFDRALLEADTDVLATINGYDFDSPAAPPVRATCTPKNIKVADVAGGLVRAGDSSITGAAALYALYWVENRGETLKGRMTDPPAEAWEFNLLKFLEKWTSPSFTITYQCTRSRSDAFGEAIGGDIGLVSGGYFLIIGYAVRCRPAGGEIDCLFSKMHHARPR
jgi:hypothetical protein